MRIIYLSVIFLLGYSAFSASAQSIVHSQFNATPLVLNPALTGMTDGGLRANGAYRSQWQSATLPFVAYHVSLDAPVMTMKNGDYFGGGLMVSNGGAGDGAINSFTGLLSASYHKVFGTDSSHSRGKGCALSVGLQAGYIQSSVDLSRAYFNDPATNQNNILFLPGSHNMVFINNVNYYAFNAGALFTQSVSRRFNYAVGISVAGINQPSDALLKKEAAAVGVDTKVTTIAGCNIIVAERFMLRPAFVYSSRPGINNYVVGNEFKYRASTKITAPDVFVGVWYRSTNVVMPTVGVEKGSLRFGLSYDYSLSAVATKPGQGFEVAMTFINHTTPKKSGRYVPCSRF